MYDTVAVLIDQPPRSTLDDPGWQQVREVTDRRTGEKRTSAILNEPSGLHVTLLPDSRLKVERSLPKALTGQNVEDLSQADVPAALDAVDRELARALGTLALPSIAEARPVRVDYCESRPLGGEDRVRLELGRLATVELPRKGMPVRGQSQSVAWPTGALRPKVYSKYLETDGMGSAFGVLRYEVGAYRLRTFRALLGLPGNHPVALHQALSEDVRAQVLTRYEREIAGGLAMAHELTDSRFLAEMYKVFGVRRAVVLIGYAFAWHAAGEPTISEALAERSPFGSRSTHYRVVSDFRRLREHLVESGYKVEEPEGTTEEGQAVVRLVRAA